jgi:hypothetical protein
VVNFTEKYAKLKEKYQKKKQKLKELKSSEDETKDKVELEEGSGCFIERAKLDSILVMSKTPTIMARGLFKECLGYEYIATHSLYGKGDLPEVDSSKRNTIFSKKHFITLYYWLLMIIINQYFISSMCCSQTATKDWR